MADDPLSVLEEIRERAALALDPEVMNLVRTYRAAESARDVPRLLAAVEAALRFHERRPLYGNASTEDEPGNCPHDPDSPLHFEAADEPGEWLCGGKHEADACSGCAGSPDGEYADWPCPEYEAILAALTGKGNDGGS